MHDAVEDQVSAATDILAAVDALLRCTTQLETEPLKGVVSRATVQLFSHIEQSCKEFVAVLLAGGCGESSELAYDKLWTLGFMGSKSEVTRRWIIQSDGLHVISQIMMAHPDHRRLQKEGSWLAYALAGVDGFVQLLQNTRGCPVTQEAVAWAVTEVAEKGREHLGANSWPQAEQLILLFLEAVKQQHSDCLLPWGCCAAIRLLIRGQSIRGNFFLAHGGAEATLKALKLGQAAGSMGASLLVAGMQLMSMLVDGNPAAAQQLRTLCALDVLVACGLSLSGGPSSPQSDKVTDETMWTLGQVGGLVAVMQVMSSAPPGAYAVRSGFYALAKLAWQQPEDGDEWQQAYASSLQPLLHLAAKAGSSGELAEKAYQALGGVLHGLAPFVAPGSAQVVDEGMNVIIGGVGAGDDSVAEAAVASIGHIASRSPAWRVPFRQALEGIGRRMRLTADSDAEINRSAKTQKSLFWAYALIAGVPGVLEQMAGHANSPQVQLAAVAAIVDILEDHADSPAAGPDVDQGVEPKHVPGALSAIAKAMHAHGMHEELQWCGCQALGLLHEHLPMGAEVPAEALESVLVALRRHPNRYKVCSGAGSALRAFLTPRCGRGSSESTAVLAQAVRVLQSRGVADTFRRVLKDFWASTDKVLLQDAFYVLGVVDGMHAVLQVLSDSDSKCKLLRCAGLTTLFELGRGFPDLVSAAVAQDMLAAANSLGEEAKLSEVAAAAALAAGPASAPVPTCSVEATEECAEILERAELVKGLVQPYVTPCR